MPSTFRVVDSRMNEKQQPVPLLTLPLPIRNEIYEHLIEGPFEIGVFQIKSAGKLAFWTPRGLPSPTTLLYVNRQIHAEYSAILYSSIHFSLCHWRFSDVTRHQVVILERLLDRIGDNIARQLARITISFPALSEGNSWLTKILASVPWSRASRLRDDGQRSILLLREKCTGLRELYLPIHSGRGLVVGEYLGADVMADALEEIDGQLRKMPCLDEVHVRNSTHRYLHGETLGKMRCFGWRVKRLVRFTTCGEVDCY
ncbi:hypothetical protein GGR57DRAFT_320850 [Xylariaceae sp. FL1272]|nr:hypothetical protein GGR57DRAFT_320850 [Xylariaceae sp. FL1272]